MDFRSAAYKNSALNYPVPPKPSLDLRHTQWLLEYAY
jgi:hypothetical protein